MTQAALANQSICPSINAIQASANQFSVRTAPLPMLGYYASLTSDFKTPNKWEFIVYIQSIHAKSESDALAKAKDAIASGLVQNGTSTSGDIFSCNYNFTNENARFYAPWAYTHIN